MASYSSKSKKSVTLFKLGNLPSFLLLLILTFGLLLLGADKPQSSLFLSFLVLALGAVSLLVLKDYGQDNFVRFGFIAWALFFIFSFLTGRVIGVEDEYVMLLSSVIVFALGVYVAKDRRRLEAAWLFMVFWMTAISVFIFFQHMIVPDKILGFDRPYHHTRLGGFFLSSNTMATFSVIGFFICLADVYRRSLKVRSKVFYSRFTFFSECLQSSIIPLIALMFLSVSLLLTASRAGIASGLVGLSVFGLIVTLKPIAKQSGGFLQRIKSLITSMAAILISAIFFWNLSGDLVAERYEQLENHGNQRLSMIEASLLGADYKPVFGHGLGSLEHAKLLGAKAESNITIMHQNAVHNVYVQWLVQAGWFGLVIMGVLLCFIFFKVFQGALHARRYRAYALSIFAIIISVMLHGIFDYALEIPVVMLTYSWMLGLGYGISKYYVDVSE